MWRCSSKSDNQAPDVHWQIKPTSWEITQAIRLFVNAINQSDPMITVAAVVKKN